MIYETNTWVGVIEMFNDLWQQYLGGCDGSHLKWIPFVPKQRSSSGLGKQKRDDFKQFWYIMLMQF